MNDHDEAYWIQRALDDLHWNWTSGDGHRAYVFHCHGDRWTATRTDSGRVLIAPGPAELRELIVSDYTRQPVSRDLPERNPVRRP